MVLASFIGFLAIFLLVGLAASLKQKSDQTDYLLAGRNIKPWLVGLSAAATTSSGYMFTGAIGYSFLLGLSSFWLLAGFIVGDIIASFFAYEKIRHISEENQANSFARVIGSLTGKNYRKVRLMSSVVILVFLSMYACAQLTAGSKALHAVFGWDYDWGIIIGGSIVLLYCYSGGMRASIWTDAVQAFIMMGGMVLLAIMALSHQGGLMGFWEGLSAIEPGYTSAYPKVETDFFWTPFLFVAGFLVSGLGTMGQPHIMTRFMSMERPEDIKKVRLYYYAWYIPFAALSVLVGMAARLIFSVDSFDNETAFLRLSDFFLPEIGVGFVLSALFAATMSTADSQVLSCASTLSCDFSDKLSKRYVFVKLSTVLVVAFVTLLALLAPKSVFTLVLFGWSALACAFTPLIVLCVLGKKPSEGASLGIMLSALGGMLAWYFAGMSGLVHEVIVGMFLGFLYFGVSSLVARSNPGT